MLPAQIRPFYKVFTGTLYTYICILIHFMHIYRGYLAIWCCFSTCFDTNKQYRPLYTPIFVIVLLYTHTTGPFTLYILLYIYAWRCIFIHYWPKCANISLTLWHCISMYSENTIYKRYDIVIFAYIVPPRQGRTGPSGPVDR